MVKKDIGQRAVLRFDWTKNAVRWRRNADNRNEVKKQDDPKDEKFNGVPPVHAQRAA